MSRRNQLLERSDGGLKSGVEPLTQRAWERVEARVFDLIEQGELMRPAEATSRAVLKTPLWIGAAALLAAACVLLYSRFDAAPSLALHSVEASGAPAASPRTDRADPPVVAPPADDASLPARAMTETTRIVTTGAPTETSIGEAKLTLAAHSDMSFSGSDMIGWLVRIERGQIDCHVAPRHGRPPFVVQAGDTRVSVVGTQFSVSRDGDAVAVSVREGHVRLSSGALELMLGPGEQWPAPVHGLASNASRRPRASVPAHSKKGPVAAASNRERDRFEQAAHLEASDPDAALALYGDLARGRGDWSANALYAEARLEFERGAFANARPLLERYLRRHPDAINAGDVRYLLRKIAAQPD